MIKGLPCIWESPFRFSEGRPHARLFRHGHALILELGKVGLFEFEGSHISMHLDPGARPIPYILGRVFALWLELNGFAVLHGSSLIHGNRAFCLLGHSGSGKSTLSAALNQNGCPLLCDDLIPLTRTDSGIVIYPGIPQSRMWPDTGERFFGEGFKAFPLVHPELTKRKVPAIVNDRNRFSEHPTQLSALFLLERHDEDGVELVELPPSKALLALIGLSFGVAETEAAGLQPARMKQLADVVECVRVMEIHYPSGFDRLDRVTEKIRSVV